MLKDLIDAEGFDLHESSDNISKRCILEDNLEYPGELHDLHKDYILAPEKD